MQSSKTKNRGLGRGLDALFADQANITENEVHKNDVDDNNDNQSRVVYVDINDIKPNESQPRKVFNEEKICELADSIRAHGIIQPLVVRKQNNIYEIVAGERRWRAARKAELKKIPCLIREFTDEENMLIAIVENMQREDLNAIEEALGFNQMIKTYGLTQDEVSKSVSKSRPYITNSIRLLKLPSEIQKLVEDGLVSAGHARALIALDDKTVQMKICRKIIEEGLSVRKIEELCNQSHSKKKKNLKKVKSPNTINVENQLKDLFGTKVCINEKGKKGKIELEYYSQDELNRLIELLKKVETN